MNARVTELRERSLATPPSISAERSVILTRFYREHLGRHSTPVLRALAFRELCEHKTITIEPGELIVGERGPAAARGGARGGTRIVALRSGSRIEAVGSRGADPFGGAALAGRAEPGVPLGGGNGADCHHGAGTSGVSMMVRPALR